MEQRRKIIFRYGIAAGAGILFLFLALLYAFQTVRTRDAFNAARHTESSGAAEETAGETQRTEAKGFYQKLRSGQPVKIWVFGDETAYDRLSELESWTGQLADGLRERYGSQVELRNFSLFGVYDTLMHYVLLQQQLGSGESADAVLLCMGYYEDPFVFPLYYEALLRSLKLRLPQTAILSLIESAAVTAPEGSADELATLTRSLTERYHGQTISMAEAFAVSGEDYPALAGGAFPLALTAEGQRLYADWILEQLAVAVSAGTEIDEALPELENAAAAVFDRYSYIPRERFTRISETDWQISIETLRRIGAESGGVVALDYSFLKGQNDVNVSIDGQLFGGLSRVYGDFETEGAEVEEKSRLRRVEIIRNNANVTDYLSVTFGTREQAETFSGLILFGNLGFMEGSADYTALPVPEKRVETAPEPEGTAPGEPESAENTETTSETREESGTRETSESRRENRERRRETEEHRQETETPAVPESTTVSESTTAEMVLEAETVPETAAGPTVGTHIPESRETAGPAQGLVPVAEPQEAGGN